MLEPPHKYASAVAHVNFSADSRPNSGNYSRLLSSVTKGVLLHI